MRDGRIDRRSLFRLLSAAGIAAAGGVPEAFAAPKQKQAPKVQAPKVYVVMLDPGHGGVDPGAIGRSGIFEKEITLPTAREVARLLEATRRYRVHLTRNDDEFVPLQDRVARARALSADLFLSMHADALPDSEMRGASVYTLSEQASDKEAAALAASENKADLIGGVDLSRHEAVVGEILFDLARRETNNLSIRLARQLVSELGQEVKLLNNSHRSAGFVVLKAPDIPSALVEMGCLSNRTEEQLLQRTAYQHKVATTLVRSINDYFDASTKA